MSQQSENRMTHSERAPIGSQGLSPRVKAGTSLFIALLVICFFAEPLMMWGQALYSRFVTGPYALYRANLENLQLQEANSRMRSELVALRTLNSRGGKLEDSVHQRLQDLEALIEQSVGLGVLKTREREQVVAQNEKSNPTKGDLAAILRDPRLSPENDRFARASGVGGAEDECADDECEQQVEKKDIALHPATLSDNQSVELKLGTRLERLISVMKFLPLGFPAEGEISSDFGRRRSPFSKRQSFHHGIDVSLRIGTRVVATGAGVVIRVAYNRTYGTLVDIEHAQGLVTRYAHLAKALVRQGQEVTRGQLIALSGSTGRSTGPHLHYEVIHNAKARDPEPFMQLADRLAGTTPILLVR